jgi:hypothetical protein
VDLQGVQISTPVDVGADSNWHDIVATPGAGKRLRLHGLIMNFKLTLAGFAATECQWSGGGDVFWPMAALFNGTIGFEQQSCPPGTYVLGPVNQSLQVRKSADAQAVGAIKLSAFYAVDH